MFINAKFNDLKNEIKWFIQRGKRGYSDLDLWEIDTWFSTVFVNMLRDFSKETHDYPPIFNGSEPNTKISSHAIPEDKNCEEYLAWKAEINRMADLFEGTRHSCGFTASPDKIQCRDEALKMLRKYYFDLWC